MTRFMREEQVGHLALGLMFYKRPQLRLLTLFPNGVLSWLYIRVIGEMQAF